MSSSKPPTDAASMPDLASARSSDAPVVVRAAALALKDSGNKWFKEGELARAQRRYKGAADMCESDAELGVDVLVPVCNNRSAVAAKQEDWAAVQQFADTALGHDAENAKALWRRAPLRGPPPWPPYVSTSAARRPIALRREPLPCTDADRRCEREV